MSKLKHTPGPWEFQFQTVTRVMVYSKETHTAVCSMKKCSEDVDNARLIAAAPEMLEALITVYDVLYGETKRKMVKSEYRELLEKATGRKISDII